MFVLEPRRTLTDSGMLFRCYELRCVNSIVPGNYSADSIRRPIPYAIADGQLKPVYAFDTSSGTPPVDGYNRSFPGNVLNSTNLLFAQCWNETDAQVWSLTSLLGPIVHFLIIVKRQSLHNHYINTCNLMCYQHLVT